MSRFVVVGLVAFAVLLGCSRVHVPNTPEGNQCVRECMVVGNTCRAPCGADNVCGLNCQAQHKNCLRTCPGATED